MSVTRDPWAMPAPRLSRRVALSALVSVLATACGAARAAAAAPDWRITRLRSLEQTARGRLGAYILDTATGTGVGWRANERFAHCSSFKLSLAAMLLRGADEGMVDLSEVLHWEPSDMLSVSPVTAANISSGLSVEALARATLVTSDNTAANVLMRRFGGPAALTAFWRTLGDQVSRMDRYEPALNDRPAGSDLDTTTPVAMARTTTALVTGNVLSVPRRATLRAWMTDVRTGSQRIRAGFPPDWQSGDKTGTGIGNARHTYVDIAYGAPAGRAPIVVTAYFEPARLVDPMDPVALETLAEVGRIAAAGLLRSPPR
ncbi:MAG: class A beta-lactamase [Gemmatimonadaceae bacterium]|nr:class A beta-lactamase [Gemmatimonadaceae bacterium]